MLHIGDTMHDCARIAASRRVALRNVCVTLLIVCCCTSDVTQHSTRRLACSPHEMQIGNPTSVGPRFGDVLYGPEGECFNYIKILRI